MNLISGSLRAIADRVIVSDMDFGEHITKSGIVIQSDDGKSRGVRPRWAKVFSKGPDNLDEYQVGDWILVEHGRWTRGFTHTDGVEEKTLRMVEADAVMMYTSTKPDTFMLGKEYANGDSFTPEQFAETQQMLS